MDGIMSSVHLSLADLCLGVEFWVTSQKIVTDTHDLTLASRMAQILGISLHGGRRRSRLFYWFAFLFYSTDITCASYELIIILGARDVTAKKTEMILLLSEHYKLEAVIEMWVEREGGD